MAFQRMLRYCALLEQNNNRAWFHENHGFYEEAKRDFTDLTEELKYALSDAVSPDLAERLVFANAKDMLYRIPRDMRVYRNQPPYNPSWRAYLAGDRHAMTPIGYFYQIAPGGRSHFGTGAWCPDAGWTRQVRRQISAQFDRFSAAVSACGYPLEGEKLKRVPKDFSPDDPAGEYLKYKDWYVSRAFADGELTDFDSFIARAVEAAKRMEPLREFFNKAFLEKPRNPWDGAWE